MNAILVISLLAIGVLAAAALAILALVITGIHGEERRVSLSEQPRTRAEILARKVLDVHVSQPHARRVFAARHASIVRHAAPPAPSTTQHPARLGFRS
ncbi:MAG TPA: hypothetical protein VNF47_10215 [Streptosporangiaceae bacterium]|nr:hypothetical protein [Streptosporangiaceae bacterium]